MKRLLVLVAAGVLLVATGATAGSYGLPAGFPSADTPNASGSIEGPAGWTTTASRPYTLTPDELQTVWQSAGNAYGIPWQVLAAINKIESNFGRNMGPSSAGGVGWMRFMPSTWERWGVDADGDGLANPWTAEDGIASAARYLAASGGATDISRAVFSYNHAQWYVDEVLQLAQLFGSGGVDVTFNLDRLQASLDDARGSVVAANRRLVRALRTARALSARERGLQRRAARVAVLSDELTLQQRAAQVGVRRAAAEARVNGLRSTLEQARQDLAAARDRSLPASFAPAAGSMLGAPSYNGQYVFPVGGGPSVVSVSHHHHDYPAADIAAPAGTPVYALADATVVRAWEYPNGRCGIGLILDAADGQEWTYCHLSYLDPAVVAGVQLAAGTQVGLVGMTGHATGPHLHLQLDPTSSYPQLQPWFQSFANVAFRWQDEGPTDSVSSRPVFAVVPEQPEATDASVVLFTR